MKFNRKGENTLVSDIIVEYIKTSPQPNYGYADVY